MARNLVIVESPAKVKTIKKFLGTNYAVTASNGHVRDLPKSQLGFDVYAADVHCSSSKEYVCPIVPEKPPRLKGGAGAIRPFWAARVARTSVLPEAKP